MQRVHVGKQVCEQGKYELQDECAWAKGKTMLVAGWLAGGRAGQGGQASEKSANFVSTGAGLEARLSVCNND
jgi:hypothetical protein